MGAHTRVVLVAVIGVLVSRVLSCGVCRPCACCPPCVSDIGTVVCMVWASRVGVIRMMFLLHFLHAAGVLYAWFYGVVCMFFGPLWWWWCRPHPEREHAQDLRPPLGARPASPPTRQAAQPPPRGSSTNPRPLA